MVTGPLRQAMTDFGGHRFVELLFFEIDWQIYRLRHRQVFDDPTNSKGRFAEVWPQPGSGKIAMSALNMADFHVRRPTSLTKLDI
jgi:hypothetical protein